MTAVIDVISQLDSWVDWIAPYSDFAACILVPLSVLIWPWLKKESRNSILVHLVVCADFFLSYLALSTIEELTYPGVGLSYYWALGVKDFIVLTVLFLIFFFAPCSKMLLFIYAVGTSLSLGLYVFGFVLPDDLFNLFFWSWSVLYFMVMCAQVFYLYRGRNVAGIADRMGVYRGPRLPSHQYSSIYRRNPSAQGETTRP